MKETPEEVIRGRVPTIADGLRAWFRVQELVETVGMPEALESSGENLRTYMLAVMEEIFEFGREMNWRPWHAPKPNNVVRMVEEFADMMAFFGLLGVYLMDRGDVTPDQIARAYADVSVKNMSALIEKRRLNGPTTKPESSEHVPQVRRGLGIQVPEGNQEPT